MSNKDTRKEEQPYIVESHVKEEQRQIEKRKESKKAGKVEHKGGASTSHKESGGKMAR